MAKKRKVVATGMKCECTPGSLGWVILSVIVAGLGLFSIVKGVSLQWVGGALLNTVGWYALGFFLCGLSKVLKCKACGTCGKMGYM